jgi:DNA-binding NtrC family response regulator
MMTSDLQILIVEDDPDQRHDLVEAIGKDLDIKEYNPKTTEAFSLENLESIWAEQFNKTLPEIAILDHRLAGSEDGIQVARWLIERVPIIRIIVLTAYPCDKSTNGEKAYRVYDNLPNPAKIDDQVIILKKEARTVASSDGMRIITVWQDVRPVLLQRIRSVRRKGSPASLELYKEFCAYSPTFQLCLQLAEKAAKTECNILITGESGTGKEMLARFIHRCSPRKRMPLVSVNCAAIPDFLIESELFGHLKGSFTGADTSREGRFRAAEGGTLFLDEIGELKLEMQAKLLRALQEKLVTPVGADHDENVNVRIIAATNCDLKKAQELEQFRSDLYYRLAGYPINIAPLRERQEDIIPLAKFFITKFSKQMGLESATYYLPDQAQQVLTEYPWPGNVRELENAIERVLVNVGTESQQITSTYFRFLTESQKKKQQQGGKSEETTVDGKEYCSKTVAYLGEWSELEIDQLMKLSMKIWRTRGEIIKNDVKKIPDMVGEFKGRPWMYVKAILAIFYRAHLDNKDALNHQLLDEIFGFTSGYPFRVWLKNKGKSKQYSNIFPEKYGTKYGLDTHLGPDGYDLKGKGIFLDVNN